MINTKTTPIATPIIIPITIPTPRDEFDKAFSITSSLVIVS